MPNFTRKCLCCGQFFRLTSPEQKLCWGCTRIIDILIPVVKQDLDMIKPFLRIFMKEEFLQYHAGYDYIPPPIKYYYDGSWGKPCQNFGIQNQPYERKWFVLHRRREEDRAEKLLERVLQLAESTASSPESEQECRLLNKSQTNCPPMKEEESCAEFSSQGEGCERTRRL